MDSRVTIILYLLAWGLPGLLLFWWVLPTRRLWKKADTSRSAFKPSSVVLPSSFGVSIIALAIPVMANVSIEIYKTGVDLWLIGFMVSGITLSVISLFYGANVVYHCALNYGTEDTITLKGDDKKTNWIAPAMSIHKLVGANPNINECLMGQKE